MRRFIFLAYGVVCYLMFLAVFLYAVGFMANAFVPKSIDSGAAGVLALAAIINIGLFGLFGLQHSLMARPTFKRWWTRFVPEPIERSTYVLMSNLCVVLILWLWRPIDVVVWHIQSPAVRAMFWVVFAAGWLMVVVTSFQLNHFDLFGLRQVWLNFRGRPYTRLKFRLPAMYRQVRHPLYVGWLCAFWMTPTMSVGHLLFAGAAMVYILIAIQFEERNLIEAHGEDYVAYRQQVPMLVPSLKWNTEQRMLAENT